MDEKGSPTEVERILIRPPESQIGPLTETERAEQINRSPYKGKYDTIVDRESAYELLRERAEQEAELAAKEEQKELELKRFEEQEKASSKTKRSSSRRQSASEALIKSAARSIGTRLGKQIIRGILGSILR